MTLTQLNAFVLVARLGSVRAAAGALGVSESAVSQAITALRQDLGDQLITRSQVGMTLTPGGTRLLGTATQIVVLGAEAHAAVRAAQGAPEQLRVVATSTFAEFVAGPLMEAFRRRFAGAVEVTTGVAASGEQAVLVANRLADVAFGPGVAAEDDDLGRGAEQPGAAGRQRHAGLAPGDQLVAEVLAQRGERLRHRGLADPEGARRRPDRPEARHQNERVQLRQGHRTLQGPPWRTGEVRRTFVPPEPTASAPNTHETGNAQVGEA